MHAGRRPTALNSRPHPPGPAAVACAGWRRWRSCSCSRYCGAPTSSTTCRAFLISSSMISSSLARAYFFRSCSAKQAGQ